MSMDFDVLIIGGGAAGKDAAFLAARAGLDTLLIEKEKLGGTSYHKGCYVIRALQMCAQSFRASGFSEKNLWQSGPIPARSSTKPASAFLQTPRWSRF